VWEGKRELRNLTQTYSKICKDLDVKRSMISQTCNDILCCGCHLAYHIIGYSIKQWYDIWYPIYNTRFQMQSRWPWVPSGLFSTFEDLKLPVSEPKVLTHNLWRQLLSSYTLIAWNSMTAQRQPLLSGLASIVYPSANCRVHIYAIFSKSEHSILVQFRILVLNRQNFSVGMCVWASAPAQACVFVDFHMSFTVTFTYIAYAY
jgi:hypothetical protein